MKFLVKKISFGIQITVQKRFFQKKPYFAQNRLGLNRDIVLEGFFSINRVCISLLRNNSFSFWNRKISTKTREKRNASHIH